MKKKILIVEDDEDLAKLTRRRLLFSDFEVMVVPDAILAIQEANQFRPDLVLLDLMLPAGGGLAVLKGLRSLVHTTYIPVLVMSGLDREADPDYFKEIEKLGIEEFIRKPFEGSRLVDVIKRILHEQYPDSPAEKKES